MAANRVGQTGRKYAETLSSAGRNGRILHKSVENRANSACQRGDDWGWPGWAVWVKLALAKPRGAMKRSIPSPFGPLVVTVRNGAVAQVTWGNTRWDDADPLLDRAQAQLEGYFAGARRDFDLPLEISGSAFQRDVCAAISAIPFGETLTYGEIARRLGAPPQAVGQACGHNPIPVIVPCHRVLAANGLGGFSARGGIETKVALLRHEGAAGLLI